MERKRSPRERLGAEVRVNMSDVVSLYPKSKFEWNPYMGGFAKVGESMGLTWAATVDGPDGLCVAPALEWMTDRNVVRKGYVHDENGTKVQVYVPSLGAYPIFHERAVSVVEWHKVYDDGVPRGATLTLPIQPWERARKRSAQRPKPGARFEWSSVKDDAAPGPAWMPDFRVPISAGVAYRLADEARQRHERAVAALAAYTPLTGYDYQHATLKREVTEAADSLARAEKVLANVKRIMAERGLVPTDTPALPDADLPEVDLAWLDSLA